MLLQFLTMLKGRHQTLHHQLFIFRQRIRIARIHRREIHILHGIFLTVTYHGLLLVIDLIQQQPLFHIPFRMSADHLPFQLKLQDGDSLMHPHIQLQITGVIIVIILDGKHTAIRLGIGLQRKGGQRYQVDAIALFQSIQIAVTGRIADHSGDAGHIPCCRPHPDHIMVAPLNV